MAPAVGIGANFSEIIQVIDFKQIYISRRRSDLIFVQPLVQPCVL